MTETAVRKRHSTAVKILSKSTLRVLAGANETSRGEFVYRALLEAIRQGRLHQGERVREDEISEWLDVSRTPVREALHRMQARGLVRVAVRGFVVTTLSRQEMIDLYATRELLEGGAARFAAQYASGHEIDALHDLLRALKEAGDDYPKGERLNHQFHDTISTAARNSYLKSALDDINDVLALLQTGLIPGRCALSLDEHTNIVKAIEERTPERAEHEARLHVREACQAALRQLTSTEVAAAGE